MAKKMLIAAMAILVCMPFVGCKNKAKDNKAATEKKDSVSAKADFPWDFPTDFKLKDAEIGQWALAVNSTYNTYVKEGKSLEDAVLSIDRCTIEKMGDKVSTVAQYEQTRELPNSLIIPIPKGQKAKLGDVVLTWSTIGSTAKRGIVTDASNPEKPKICYLDYEYMDDGKGLANKYANVELEPNSFVVIKSGDWVPGAPVVFSQKGSWKYGFIINCTKNKVLISGFVSKISCVERSQCKLIPFDSDIKVGDDVSAKFVTSLESGYTVKKVDKKIGRVWVERNGATSVPSIIEVMKGL